MRCGEESLTSPNFSACIALSVAYQQKNHKRTSRIKTESRKSTDEMHHNVFTLTKSFAQLLLRNSATSGPRVLSAKGSGAHYFGVMEQANIINKKRVNDSKSIPKSNVVKQIGTMSQHFKIFPESSQLHCRCPTACLRASLQASRRPWLSGAHSRAPEDHKGKAKGKVYEGLIKYDKVY